MIRLIQMFIVAMLVMLGYYWAPKLDGQFFPVISDTQITEVQPIIISHREYTIVSAMIRKVRNCDIRAVDFYVGSFPDHYISARHEDLRIPNLPSQDPEVFVGPYQIFAPLELLINNSFAIASHDCYNGWFWRTETILNLGGALNDFLVDNP